MDAVSLDRLLYAVPDLLPALIQFAFASRVIFIQSILRVPFPLTIYSFWKTYPSQVLELRVWCETVEADCIKPGWVRYLQGSIWFDLRPGTLQRNPLEFRWNGDYSCRITVVAPHSAVTDVVIQLLESGDGSISCLNLAGEEVLSVPPNTDVRELRHKLA